MLASASACSNRCRAVTRMSRASFSRSVADERILKDYKSRQQRATSDSRGQQSKTAAINPPHPQAIAQCYPAPLGVCLEKSGQLLYSAPAFLDLESLSL